MEIKRLKHQVKLCEEDRTEMKRRTKLPLISDKMTKLLKGKIKRKDAEIATIQVCLRKRKNYRNQGGVLYLKLILGADQFCRVTREPDISEAASHQRYCRSSQDD